MNPQNHPSKKPSKDVVMEEEKVKEDRVKPLLEMVTEDDVDKNALSQLLALGYDKEISLIALRKVGTQYGSLGYDGLNKAIDFIEKKKIQDLNQMYNPINSSEIKKAKEEEKKKEKLDKYLELKKTASLEAKQRYESLKNQMGKKDANISILSNDIINCYSFGKGSKGQLGLGERLLETSFPTKIRTLKGIKVRLVACGPRNTLFLAGDNKLYKTNITSCTPVRIFERELSDHRLIDLAAGSSHFLALNSDGNVLSWGDNESGQLGVGDGKNQDIPKVIDSLVKVFINRISCGAAHSMAITKTGNAFVWGSNARGQLGYDTKICKFLSIPTKVCLMLKEVDLLGEERVAEVSSNDYPMEEEKKDEVKVKDSIDCISNCVCGTWSSIFVTQTSKTRLHVWGSEENNTNSTVILSDPLAAIAFLKSRGDSVIYTKQSGELFEYSIKAQQSKFIVKLEKFKDISLGSGYMGIIHHDNTLHMRGNNRYGQLGTGNKQNIENDFEQIQTIEPTRINKVSCGLINSSIIAKYEESKMNLKMTNLIIDKIFSQDLFEQNPELKELLQIIIQNMGTNGYESQDNIQNIISALFRQDPQIPIAYELAETASTARELISSLTNLSNLLQNSASSPPSLQILLSSLVSVLHSSLLHAKSIIEEDECIKIFELDRIKQELAMRGQSAVAQEEAKMAAYRRRVREEDPGDLPMPPIIGMPQPPIIGMPRPPIIGMPNPFAGPRRDVQMEDQENEMQVDQDPLINYGDNQEEVQAEGDQEEAKEQEQRGFMTGVGVKIGGQDAEQDDPRAARLKWLENMNKNKQ